MASSSKRKKWILGIIAVLAVALGIGAFKLRDEAGGWRNVVSLSYWRARASGDEMYRASVALFARGNRAHRDVCFTFDDGPHIKGAPFILDALKKEGIHGTFFVVGIRVREHPELVKRMIDEGNEVGNHTQNHPRLNKISLDKVRSEIQDCQINIERACGRKTTLFRPPGMDVSHETMLLFKKMGYTTVWWNVGAHDFIPATTPNMTAEQMDDMNTTPNQVAERILQNVKPGVIILLHDNPVTAAALPTIIEKLKQDGYGFKTVTEMLAELPTPIHVIANPIDHDKYAFQPFPPLPVKKKPAVAPPAVVVPGK